MIERGTGEKPERKMLGSESVHGLPLDWSGPRRRASRRTRSQRLRHLLATQNVHGLPTSWTELDLSA